MSDPLGPERLAELRSFVASLDGLTSPEGLALLDHIEALEARITAVRALHAPLEMPDTSVPGCEVVCQHCKDHDLGEYGNYIPWPCPTIKILDGIE